MGINIFSRSKSSFDKNEYQKIEPDLLSSFNNRESLPNPNPLNYEVLRHQRRWGHLVIEIKYLDCTNYEGKKILVFENTTELDLLNQKLIDPHFSDNPLYHSPIARFEPTERGWRMANFFVDNYCEI